MKKSIQTFLMLCAFVLTTPLILASEEIRNVPKMSSELDVSEGDLDTYPLYERRGLERHLGLDKETLTDIPGDSRKVPFREFDKLDTIKGLDGIKSDFK